MSPAELAISAGELKHFDLTDVDPAAEPTLVEIVRATGGWPLAVHLAVEATRRTGPLDRSALVDHLLAPNTVLFDYLAEDVVAGLTATEHELLALAGHVPELSEVLLTRVGRGDLVPRLASLTADRIFLEPVPIRPGHAAATLLGGAFIRRVLPPPDNAVLSRIVDALVALGDIDQALVLSARVGDPDLAQRVVLTIDRPDQLSATAVLSDVLSIAESSGPHPHIAELRGDLHYFAGAWDEALAAYTTAADLGDRNATRLARKRANILYLRGRFDEANAVGAAVEPGGSDPGERARVLACLAVICWARGDIAGCDSLVTPAEELARRSGDDAAAATVYTAKAMLAALQGDLPANRRYYQRALDHAERAGDVNLIVRIRTNRGSRFTSEGDYADALTELDQAIRLAELTGSDTFSALAHCNRGETSLLMGNIDVALTETRRAQAIWTRLGSDRMLYALVQLGQIQLLRGQRSEAISIFNEAVRLAKAQGDTQGMGPGLVGLAQAFESDDPDVAADYAKRAIDSGNPVWMPRALAAAASVALRRGARESALHLVSDAIGLATKRRDRPALGEALLVRAALDRPPSASIASEAKRLWQDLGNPIGEARADVLIAAHRDRRAPPGTDRQRRAPALRRRSARPACGDPQRRRRRSWLVGDRDLDARRVPGFPRGRARGRQRVGITQSAGSRQAPRRPPRSARGPRRSGRDPVAGRAGQVGAPAVGAAQHGSQRVRSRQVAAARPLRRRRPRHGVARARSRRHRRRAVHRRGRGRPPASRRRRHRDRGADAQRRRRPVPRGVLLR